MNNETVNIWSHGLAAAWFFWWAITSGGGSTDVEGSTETWLAYADMLVMRGYAAAAGGCLLLSVRLVLFDLQLPCGSRG